MKEADFYPAGAYNDPNAPYNQIEPKERRFQVEATETLVRRTYVHTSDYNSVFGRDEDGTFENIDTTDTDWYKVYISEHYTMEELLKELKDLAIEKYAQTKDRKYKLIAESCQEYIVFGLEVEELHVEDGRKI